MLQFRHTGQSRAEEQRRYSRASTAHSFQGTCGRGGQAVAAHGAKADIEVCPRQGQKRTQKDIQVSSF